jgi:hypothetical protein
MASRLFLLLTILVVGGSSFAQQNILKEDFAFGSEIEITDNKSVIDVILPEDVYQVTKSNTLADLAVFNSKGEVVPHILVTPESKVIDKSLPSEDLTLFPVYGAKNSESNFSNIKISTAKDGTIVEIQSGNKVNKKDKSKKTVVGYLVDATKIKNKIEKFQISLDGVQDNYFIKVILEGSQDLKNWSAIESEAVLAKFEVNNEKLKKDKVQLSGSAFTYYRISWPSTSDEIKLSSVKAIFSTEKEKVEEPLQWKPVTGIKTPAANDKIIYQYDVGGYYPVSGLKVQFADQNSIARVSIEAANDEKGAWSPIQTSTFFTVIKEGAELSNLQVNFSDRQFRFWRLHLNSNLAGVGSRFPDITFGWRPNIVRFLARGEGPFTLAYGSSKAINVPQSDLINADWTKEVGKGNLKSKVAFGGPEKLVVEKKSEYPIRKIMLWGVLLLGVVLLGSMAFQVKKLLFH